jgi:hypothetical protein
MSDAPPSSIPGYDLNIRSGRAGEGSNIDGGDLCLYPGLSTGSGDAYIRFFGYAFPIAPSSTLQTYAAKALMDRSGRWSFGHINDPTSTMDIQGDVRLRGSASNNAAFLTGIRFNNSSSDLYEAEIRGYQGANATKIGLTFRTSDSTTNAIERMRINPNGGIQITDETFINSSSYTIQSGSGGAPGNLVTLMSFVSQPHDRIVYCTTNNGLEYLPLYPLSGLFYARYEIINSTGTVTIILKEMIIQNTDRSIYSALAHSFILPAGWSFRMVGYRTSLVLSNAPNSISIQAKTVRFGLQ